MLCYKIIHKLIKATDILSNNISFDLAPNKQQTIT